MWLGCELYDRGWIPGRGRDFYSSLQCPDRLWSTHRFLYSGCGGWSGRGVKLITHLHLVSRLRIPGFIPPLPHTSSWSGYELSTWSDLHLPFLNILRYLHEMHTHNREVLSVLIFSETTERISVIYCWRLVPNSVILIHFQFVSVECNIYLTLKSWSSSLKKKKTSCYKLVM
jgi:hypothetical protein